jgi:hypothetical protein
MTEDARDRPSPLVALAAMAPDAAFGVARALQRAAFAAAGQAARAAGLIAGTPPVRASLSLLESQVRPLAERGTTQRRTDEEQLRTFLIALEPLVTAVLQMVVELLPIDAILNRVDIDALIRRVDVDALIRRVDVDDIVRRVDIPRIVTDALEGIELGDLIADSTTSIATDARDGVRVEAIRADSGLASVVDRILRRRKPRDLVVPDYRWSAT